MVHIIRLTTLVCLSLSLMMTEAIPLRLNEAHILCTCPREIEGYVVKPNKRQYGGTPTSQTPPPPGQIDNSPAQTPASSPVPDASNYQNSAVPQPQNNPVTPSTIDPATGMPVNKAPSTIDPATGMPMNKAPSPIDPATGMPVKNTPTAPETSASLITGDQGHSLPYTPTPALTPSPATPSGVSVPTNVNNGTSTYNHSANNTYGNGGGDMSISEEEFQKAVQAAGGSPTAEQYKAFADGQTRGSDVLANVLHESGGLKYKAEIRCQGNGGCPGEYGSPPGGPMYYGRGYIQITWKDNYSAASTALFGDDRLVTNPDQVATDESIAWGVTFHYWLTRVHTSEGVVSGRFGESVNKINGALECGGAGGAAVAKRQEYYKGCLSAFGISEQPDFSGC
ncbi:hypothetical protein IWQ61_003691 [Dispira simplex]|nr:hypothetical protein IWQ61_003691 [Dispira simplex]